ncbi:hypothetical protein Dvul_2551 [Nitratidesulfovibrio vulgaris DP4]|uniref:Uncharacterized protein n=1 Tax=Nitratidesulfovibrio vulgaris (strain DP4) TaxID=391774 RepID=A0A0H3AB72_NITV4|nr:hypothetical protein Dvul_2551 [Nitratidesulfovibrio vulgaris DP4]
MTRQVWLQQMNRTIRVSGIHAVFPHAPPQRMRKDAQGVHPRRLSINPHEFRHMSATTSPWGSVKPTPCDFRRARDICARGVLHVFFTTPQHAICEKNSHADGQLCCMHLLDAA